MKKLLLLLSVILMLVSFVPAYAAEDQILFEDTITVTNEGGRYQIGFVNVEFKKNFLGKDMESMEIDVEVYAEGGKVYVEFTPDIPDFEKNVHIRVDNYHGLLYDVEEDENAVVEVMKQQIIASHFSRYCLNW